MSCATAGACSLGKSRPYKLSSSQDGAAIFAPALPTRSAGCQERTALARPRSAARGEAVGEVHEVARVDVELGAADGERRVAIGAPLERARDVAGAEPGAARRLQVGGMR